MKLCISSTGDNLDANVDQRFGRCSYFLVVDTETMETQAIPNAAVSSSGGAGIQAAQIVTKQKIQSVITGNIGPNAFQILEAAGIKVFTGAEGTIRNALDTFKKGKLQETGSANVETHAGLKR